MDLEKNIQSDSLNSERYARQMIITEIGPEGQEKLSSARVLIIGAGGLGTPCALYLAGAGIGTIGIADADEVSVSNLHRQVMHPFSRVGVNKAESAKASMLALNEEVNVVTYPYFLTPDNIQDIINDYDFVIDCVDNFETKFLINDTCVKLRKPFCHGGVIRFNGQVMTYVPGQGPCYRCIFEDVPAEGDVPNNADVGVTGPAVGVIGSIQALEAIKYITGIGELLTGRMLVFDGLTMETRIAKFPKASIWCPACGGK